MKGKFIVIEGLEGAGKTTAQSVVKSQLRMHGITNIIFTHEPGGTKIAEKLRALIKYGLEEEKVTDIAELLMIYTARVQLVETVIKPAIKQGAFVICDRHDLSSQAYQGGGRGINQNLLQVLRDNVLGNFRPNLTLYLDVTPIIGLQRIRTRCQLDRIEQESLLFFERTRRHYLSLASNDSSIKIIDATQSLDDVTLSIKCIIRNWIMDHLF